jgi:hypothetical protein
VVSCRAMAEPDERAMRFLSLSVDTTVYLLCQ